MFTWPSFSIGSHEPGPVKSEKVPQISERGVFHEPSFRASVHVTVFEKGLKSSFFFARGTTVCAVHQSVKEQAKRSKEKQERQGKTNN